MQGRKGVTNVQWQLTSLQRKILKCSIEEALTEQLKAEAKGIHKIIACASLSYAVGTFCIC
jgi:hypothetical protein